MVRVLVRILTSTFRVWILGACQKLGDVDFGVWGLPYLARCEGARATDRFITAFLSPSVFCSPHQHNM